MTTSLLAVLALGVLVAGAAAVGTGALDGIDPFEDPDPVEDGPLETFDDSAEYAAYVERGGGAYTGGVRRQRDVEADRAAGGDGGGNGDAAQPQAATPMATPSPSVDSGGSDGDRRVAGTNVQEGGIDEPDLVKTDGRYFYYAPAGRASHQRPMPEPTPVADEEPGPPPEPAPVTHVLDTEEPTDPELVENVEVSGRMLRSGDTLIVIATDAVVAYDVSDPTAPTRLWERPLESALVSARAQEGQLYLVTREPASASAPCPLEPVGPGAPVDCGDIHHPGEPMPVDATYTALALDPGSGDVTDSTGFVGTRDGTVVYMSEDALYVTHTTRTDRVELATDYVLNESERVPDHVKERIREVREYELSPQAERAEISHTMEAWFESMDEEKREAAQESLRQGIEAYAAQRQRQLTETGVVRIGVGDGDLGVDAVGAVPGEPLNQFSLDEHDGTLRIATTIPGVAGADSENDLYTLDATSLAQQGKETGMGVTEEIYAVRYVGDTAYMVTFRRVDPFHVVDLSDPANPEEVGELKLPGFSDYLHPVGDGTIVGIGQEDGRTKVVLFDATDPTDPQIADSTLLGERFSAVSRTHHAFMQDARHEVIFLPAGENGVVMSYADGGLSVEKRVVLDGPAQRARYVGDYLYVFGPREITVLDETTWQAETTLDLPA